MENQTTSSSTVETTTSKTESAPVKSGSGSKTVIIVIVLLLVACLVCVGLGVAASAYIAKLAQDEAQRIEDELNNPDGSDGSDGTTDGGSDGSDGSDGSQETPEGFLKFESFLYGVAIVYPDDWTKTENSLNTIVIFKSPIAGTNDTFQENFNIVTEDISSNPMDLDEYTDLSVAQIKNSGAFPEFKQLSLIDTELDGNPAKQIVYTTKQGAITVKLQQTWTIKDDTAYVLTYGGETTSFDNFTDLVNVMINSFTIN